MTTGATAWATGDGPDGLAYDAELDGPDAAGLRREAAATVAAAALLPFAWLRRPRPTARRAEQRTVVLVHGCFATSATLLPLEAYLRAHGVKQILVYDYGARKGLEAAARGLDAFLKRHVRGGRIDLVGHSFGGLVARAYLQLLGGARRVDRLVTLGTPHRGTYAAFWLASRTGRELRPGSPILRRLHATSAAAASVRCLSILGGTDTVILPRESAGNEAVMRVGGVGHLGMLFTPRVARAVLSHLTD